MLILLMNHTPGLYKLYNEILYIYGNSRGFHLIINYNQLNVSIFKLILNILENYLFLLMINLNDGKLINTYIVRKYKKWT